MKRKGNQNMILKKKKKTVYCKAVERAMTAPVVSDSILEDLNIL